MKRLFLPIAASAAICISANAQEAFKHLSAGIELGTTGIGAELALPVINNHLVIKAGATFPCVKIPLFSEYNISSFTGKANEYIIKANQYITMNCYGAQLIESLPETAKLDASASVNLVSFKAILEYYPSKNSGFHISAGVYAGSGQLVSGDACASTLWNLCEKALDIIGSYPEMTELIGSLPDLVANIEGRTFQIKDPGNVNVGLGTLKLRPYFGIGFGRSVPYTRCGFQFDLGAIYLGRLSILSANEIPYRDSLVDVTLDTIGVSEVVQKITKFVFYPVIDFRFIIRLF